MENNDEKMNALDKIDEEFRPLFERPFFHFSQNNIIENKEEEEEEEYGEVLFMGTTHFSRVKSKSKRKLTKEEEEKFPDVITPHRIKNLLGKKIKYITAGAVSSHMFVIDENGKCYGWGRNTNGQLGLGDTKDRQSPTLIESLADKNIIKITCGKQHSVFLCDDKKCYVAGSNNEGQCGTGAMKSTKKYEENIIIPIRAKVNNCTDISCGQNFTLWLCNGAVYSAGSSQHGVLGHNTENVYNAKEFAIKLAYMPVATPKKIVKLKGFEIIAITSGPCHSLALSKEGFLFTWGRGDYGALGHHIQRDELRPYPIEQFLYKNRINTKNPIIAAGGWNSFAVSNTERTLYGWGALKKSGDSQMYPLPFRELAGWDIRSMSCGYHTFAVAAEDSAIIWGNAESCELGLAKNGRVVKSSAQPKRIMALEGEKTLKMACGYGFTLCLVVPSSVVDKLPVFDADSHPEEKIKQKNVKVKRKKQN